MQARGRGQGDASAGYGTYLAGSGRLVGDVLGPEVSPGRPDGTERVPAGTDEAWSAVDSPKSLVTWRVVLATKWAAAFAH